MSIEAKSGTGDALYVQPDQIQRCLLIRDMFGYYDTKHVILAFKFMRKKRFTRKKQIVYEKRRLVEYYKIADKLRNLDIMTVVKCTLQMEGHLLCLMVNSLRRIYPDYVMPFQISTQE